MCSLQKVKCFLLGLLPPRGAGILCPLDIFGFLNSLRIELAGTGVDVTMIAPDFVLSEIHRHAMGADGRPLGRSPLQEEKIMTAEECAALIVPAMETRDRLLITSLRGKVGRWIRVFFPGLVDRIAGKAIRERK